MKTEKQRNHNGRFTSPDTERRRAWLAMRQTTQSARVPMLFGMTIVEHLGALQRAAEGRKGGAK